jgi:outer membrane protein assembly factor BamB
MWVALIFAGLATAADWPQFRGPNSSGLGTATNLPVEFGPQRNVEWKTALPPGHSSPILIGDTIFLTAYDGDALLVLNLERATGRIRWRREVPRPRKQALHKSNSPASPSPVSDGRNIYAFFTDFGLISFGPDGNERWRLPLGPFNNPFGMGASPLLVGNRLIVNCDSETGSFLIAVDKDSGKQLWRVERPESSRGFSTPVLYQPKGGPTQALIAGSNQLTAVNVATGEPVWWTRGLTWQLKPTPVLDAERLYILGWAGGSDEGNQEELPPFKDMLAKLDANKDGKLAREEVTEEKLLRDWKEADLDKDGLMGDRDWTFYQGRRRALNSIMAVRLGGKGDVTGTHVDWRYTRSLPNVPSPLVYQNVVYLMKEGGILTALEAATGKVLKQGRLTGALDQYFASPVASDGKLYLASQGGHITVVKAGAEWEILAVNEMDDECYATPALVENRIYVRTRSALYCFRNPQP